MNSASSAFVKGNGILPSEVFIPSDIIFDSLFHASKNTSFSSHSLIPVPKKCKKHNNPHYLFRFSQKKYCRTHITYLYIRAAVSYFRQALIHQVCLHLSSGRKVHLQAYTWP
jgi:hypothetical protein